MYTFRYQVTEDDYFQYNLYHCYSISTYRNRLMLQKYLTALLLVICGIMYSSSSFDYPVIGYAVFGVFVILWLVFFRQIVIIRQIRKSIEVMRKTGKVPFDKEVTMIFDEEKIRSEADDAQMSAPYSSIEKIVTGENALFLYKWAIEAYVLPYRAFSGEEEKEAFLRFLAQKTNAAVIPGVTK